jgi:hypothetical protein
MTPILLAAASVLGTVAAGDPAPPAPAPASATPTAAATAPVAPDPCAGPAEGRAPDPRCGDTLDGRVPFTTPVTATRAALAVPRLAARAVFWPVVRTSEAVEHYQLLDRMTALLTTDDGLVGVRPVIHYSTSFIPSGGLRFFYDRLPGAGSEIAGQLQTGGPRVLFGELDLRAPRRLGLVLSATWNRRDDRLFAGVGPHTTSDLEAMGQGIARFGSDNFGAALRWSRPLPKSLVAYAHGDVQRRDYTAANVNGGPPVTDLYGLDPAGCAAVGLPSPCVDPAQLPGFTRGLRIAHAGGGLGLGLRAPGREQSGASLVADANFAQGVAGDPSRHATFSAEGVLALGAVNRSLVLRARAAMVEPLGSAPIPFEELVSPSGVTGMRGFPDGRFRGESGMVGTAEYRWYVSSFLDATVFSDVGTVAGRTFSGIDWDRWFPSFGVGLRMFKTLGSYWEALPMDEIQVAYAPDGGVHLLLSLTGF